MGKHVPQGNQARLPRMDHDLERQAENRYRQEGRESQDGQVRPQSRRRCPQAEGPEGRKEMNVNVHPSTSQSVTCIFLQNRTDSTSTTLRPTDAIQQAHTAHKQWVFFQIATLFQ